MSNKKYFYARTTPYNLQHMTSCIEQAFKYEGFSFVDVKMPCLTEQIRLKKIKGLVDAKKDYVENKIYVDEIRELKDNEYGVNKND
jgi:pyruvate/2-oxoacid:ferredoxin oxidoreductase beta subunit